MEGRLQALLKWALLLETCILELYMENLGDRFDLFFFEVSVLCKERNSFDNSIVHVFRHPLNEIPNTLWNISCVVNKNNKHASKAH